MRYTTIIDISEMPSLYRNKNACLVYLHLVLQAGYHDDDRDLAAGSIRALAAALGLSVAAVRHALEQLEKSRLIERQGPFWHVRKWVQEQPISPRARTAREQKKIEDAARLKMEKEERERAAAIEAQRREFFRGQGKTQFMVYYEQLQQRAAAGDAEAAALVERHRKTYEAHAAALSSNHQ